ncbi:MAG: MarR family transcriptional regulator [Burkholderiaceae bacterium]|nr:MarR family transcriptional regulator [Burkholderiaceae bacterium]
MSPARTLANPDPNAEARQRRHATAKAKKLLREGMARLQTVLDDRFIIDETPLEAIDAMQFAADAMHAALHQLDAADSIGRPDAATPAGAPTRQQGQFLAYIGEYVAANRAGVAPSHADLQRFFNLTPPSVNSMLKRLERCGFIRRVPGKARAIEVLVPAAHLPPLERPFKF